MQKKKIMLDVYYPISEPCRTVKKREFSHYPETNTIPCAVAVAMPLSIVLLS